MFIAKNRKKIKKATLLLFVVSVAVFLGTSLVLAQNQGDGESMNMSNQSSIDVSDVELCDSRNPTSWRDAQVVDGVEIEEDPSCYPDMPSLIAAATKGTNNVSTVTLNETGLAPDAVVKENDKDGDGDPDVIHINIEIVGANEGKDPVITYEIAPGIMPAVWAFAPKSTGMATEGMTGAHLMRLPSPTIRIEQGDEVTMTVANTHYMPHTVHLHGVDHPFVTEEGEGNDGVPQASEVPIMPGESRTYTVNARTAGSMMFHCHVQPDVHVLMGLNGMFVVEENRPNNWVQTFNVGSGKVRHRSVASREEYGGEFDLHYQGMDKQMHELVQGIDDPTIIARRLNNQYDITERTPDYFTLNGKSFPYTLRESQIIVDPDSKYRLRVINAGSDSIALHTHGHKVLVKSLDGVDLPAGTEYYRDVVDVHAAQRADLILNTTDDGLNNYGPGIWLYHSHKEAHVTTDGISPGGNVSMITYRSFLGEDGMPNTLGADIRPTFTAEYYQKKLDIWDPYDKFNLFGRKDAQTSRESGGMSLPILPAVVGVLGIIIGFMVGILISGRKKKVHE